MKASCPTRGTSHLAASHPRAWLQVLLPLLSHDELCTVSSPPFIPAIFASHVLILLMPEQFETLIYRQFPDLVPKACDSLSAFQRHVCWGRNPALPVNPICDKDFPGRSPSTVLVLLCACLASFWGTFVLLFHLRKDSHKPVICLLSCI